MTEKTAVETLLEMAARDDACNATASADALRAMASQGEEKARASLDAIRKAIGALTKEADLAEKRGFQSVADTFREKSRLPEEEAFRFVLKLGMFMPEIQAIGRAS
ncbi:MAG: hypothetical protein ACRED4_00065 [Brevundimonas sp.]